LGQSEPKDPNNVRVIQRKLVYIVGMPNEFASEKVNALHWECEHYDHDSSLPVISFDEYEINANRMLFMQLLRQKNFLGQYGKIENIIIGNIGANQQIPDSGRV
jgi:CCR4-NOT transcription complex subunit 4